MTNWSGRGCVGRLAALLLPLVVVLFCSTAALAGEVSNLVGISKTERSVTDRRTLVVTTTATVTVLNSSTRTITTPVHAVLDISSPAVQVTGAVAPGAANPYGKYYVDLSGKLAAGALAPGKSVSFTVNLACASSVRYSYQVRVFGSVATANLPPVASAGPDQTVTLFYGQSHAKVTLDGSGSRDTDGTVSSYSWSGAPQPANSAKPTVQLGEGQFSFSLTVTDDKGMASLPDTVSVTVVKEVVHAPLITLSAPPYQVAAGSSAPLVISVAAQSPDGRKVSLSAGPQLKNASFTSTGGTQAAGTFSFKPDYSQAGKQFLSFVARDVYDITSTLTVPVEVVKNNRSPQLMLQESAAVHEGGTLSIPVVASDPDGDPVTLSATGLPQNAFLSSSAGTLVFTPDYSQAGSYPVGITASDGSFSVNKTVTITVRDVPGGPPAQGELALAVASLESPTFLASQRITGTVNGSGAAPAPARQALITGMQPTSGSQGSTLEVTLDCAAAGYPCHFASGISQASFGDGITVQSLAVNGAQQAVATLVIDPQATPGSRSVTVNSAGESAVSVLAFSVMRGTSTVTGRLLDGDSGQPLAGATAVIGGTTLVASTAADGSFTLTGVPTGTQTLLLSATNHQLVSAVIEPLPNATLKVPDLRAAATVFVPGAAPAVSLMSLVGRRGTDPTVRPTRDQAYQLIRDAWMLLGGEDAGILDQYGNQLNPQVTGSGVMSLSEQGLRRLAEQMSQGKTMSLQELLYAFSSGFSWSQNAMPPLKAWLDRLQQMADQAWTEPTDMNNALVILIFNRGATLSPTAPVIRPEMRLNMLQMNLLVSSFLIYTCDPLGNQAALQPKPILLAYNGQLLDQLFTGAINPTSQGGKSVMRNFWKNYFSVWSNFPQSTLGAVAGTAFGIAISMATTGGIAGTAVATGILSFFSGMVADILIQMMVSMNLAVLVPQPPIPSKAEYYTENGQGRVKVTFHRSVSDSHPEQDLGNQIRYWYTLYRYSRPPLNLSDNPQAVAVANFCSNCPETWSDLYPPDLVWLGMTSNPLEVVDPNPVPGKINYYDMMVTRLVGMKTELAGTDDNLGSTMDWSAGVLPSATFQVNKTDVLGTGVLMTAVSPVFSLANGIKQLTSDFSGMISSYAGDTPDAAADEVEVDPVKGFVYHSDLFNKALFRSEWAGEHFLRTTKLADTGFKDSQVGLALDAAGNLYTDNQASDSLFGGRVFRFTPTGVREHVGCVNYFSQLLMYAKPANVSRMTMGPNGRLYVTDEICSCVKELAVDLAIDPNRIVGQPYAELEPHGEPVQDMAFGPPRDLYVLATPFLHRIAYNGTLGIASTPERYLDLSRLSSSGFGGLAVDGYRNLYLSQKGSGAADGRVLMFPFDTCFANRNCDPVPIMDNLNQPGDLELSKDGRSLFIATAGGKLEKRIFGVTGQVKDFFGNPLAGAVVSYQVEPLGYSGTAKTDGNGFYRFDSVFRADLINPYLDLSVEYDGRTQVFLTKLGQPNLESFGHTIRNITFNP
jgi:hypothetical protein